MNKCHSFNFQLVLVVRLIAQPESCIEANQGGDDPTALQARPCSPDVT
jgi:hypothetical protein